MKKYFPVFIFIVLFTGYLFSQVYWNYEDSAATPGDITKKRYAHYKANLRSSTFISTTGKRYVGKKIKAPVVILNFWASWCAPCLEEFPSIVAMKNKFNDNQVLVLGINTDEEKQLEKISKTQKEYKLNFPLISDSLGKYVQDFMITAIPISIVFHRGKVIEVIKGGKDFNSEETLEHFKELIR